MDNRMMNLWLTVTALVMGLIGLAFVLVSVFDAGASGWVLAAGLLFIAGGNLFNLIRLRQNRKNTEEE